MPVSRSALTALIDGLTNGGANTAAAVRTVLQAIADAAANLVDDAGGWIAGEAWTYVSATTFSVAADVTAKYSKGDRIKLTQTTVKFFYVVGVSAFSGGITTITVTGGSDYTLANAAISSPFYSKVQTPNGFPQWFNYVPVLTGYSADPIAVFARFCLNGQTCEVKIAMAGAFSTFGVSNTNALTFSLPIPAANITATPVYCFGHGIAFDSGARQGASAWLEINFNGATVVNVYKSLASQPWTASGFKMLERGGITFPI